MLDRIFKNNMIMGLVAITTLVLVGIMFWRVQKANENCEAAVKAGATLTE